MKRRRKNAPLLRVPGRGWIQESYETGDPQLRERAAMLRRMGYRAKSAAMGSQVTQYGVMKLTLLDIRPGTSGDEWLERVPEPNPYKPGHAAPKPQFTRPTPIKTWRDIYQPPDYTGPGRLWKGGKPVEPKGNPEGKYSIQTRTGAYIGRAASLASAKAIAKRFATERQESIQVVWEATTYGQRGYRNVWVKPGKRTGNPSHYYYVVYDKEKGFKKLDYVDGPYNSFSIVKRIAKDKNRLEGYQRFVARKVRAEDPPDKLMNPIFATKRSTVTGYRVGSTEHSTLAAAIRKATEYANDDPGFPVEVIKWSQKSIPGRMWPQYDEKVMRTITAKPKAGANPTQKIFPNRAAAMNYIRAHGLRGGDYSLKQLS